MHQNKKKFGLNAFTIIELMVSIAVLAALLVILSSIISHISSVWTHVRGKVEQFREARHAFDTLTRRLGEATLGTYLDYEDKNGLPRSAATSITFVPKAYGRQSELRFLSGPSVAGDSHAIFFQSPLGRTSSNSAPASSKLLNTLGYFIEYGEDSSFLPAFIPPKIRPRLMEFCEPSDQLSIYTYTSGTASAADRKSRNWFQQPLLAQNPPVSIVAENIIALIFLPLLPGPDRERGGYTESSLAQDYLYDSTQRNSDPNLNPLNQLPAVVRVTMIAIDEQTANRLDPTQLEAIKGMVGSLFLKADNYDEDINSLESMLIEIGANFHVFSTNVILKNAKWSRE